jgi:hypothetical protein
MIHVDVLPRSILAIQDWWCDFGIGTPVVDYPSPEMVDVTFLAALEPAITAGNMFNRDCLLQQRRENARARSRLRRNCLQGIGRPDRTTKSQEVIEVWREEWFILHREWFQTHLFGRRQIQSRKILRSAFLKTETTKKEWSRSKVDRVNWPDLHGHYFWNEIKVMKLSSCFSGLIVPGVEIE